MKAIISDTHCHGWSAFAKTDADGVNSRLRLILNEIERAAEELKRKGGDLLVHAGDCFHTRGNIAPKVLNPVRETFKRITASGVEVVMIAGNHDLTDNKASSLGNASRALQECGVQIVDAPVRILATRRLALFAWEPEPQALVERMRETFAAIENKKPGSGAEFDAIIHAPVNAVIKGLPDHGIEAATLAAIGFRRVYSGHYHDHKSFFGNKVISIGATTHQTWSDVGTLAGFVLDEGGNSPPIHVESAAPKFVDLEDMKSLDDARGNYVRISQVIESEGDIALLRAELEAAGALGSIIKPQKKQAATGLREVAAAGALATMEGSIDAFIKARHGGDAALIKLCLDILADKVS